MKTLNFGGVNEIVYERSDVPLAKMQKLFSQDLFSVIGYGVQARLIFMLDSADDA